MKDAIKIIKLICEILDDLSEEEISALINKKARFKVEFPNQQKSAPTPPKLTEDFFRKFDSLKTREDAKALFEQFDFRKVDLMKIVKHYSIPVIGKESNAQIVDRIIEAVVGSKLKHETLLTTNIHGSE